MRTIELPELDPLRALDDRPVPSFLKLQFEEALALFLERRIMSPEEFEALSDAERTRAFTATQLASDTLRQRAFDSLTRAIEEGSTLSDFAREVRDGEVALGITASDPAYLETVYRTNLASAYGAGRYTQITSEVVRAARPYVQFRATLDSRTTDICAAINGKVVRQDDPGWPNLAPPRHFSCRTVVLALADLPPGVDLSDAASLPPCQAGFDAPPTS